MSTDTTPRPAPIAADTAPAVELAGLTKSFRTPDGPVHAVRGVDLTIRGGEVVAFLGPNGAGKTTTLDMVLGLTEPSTGTARVFGLRPRDAVAAGRISAVLQTGGLLRDLTVRETVVLIASMYAEHTPVEEVIERAGLTALQGRMVSKCSGGEQQRLRFALALLPDPDLLVLDEPTAGMDVAARRDFWRAMHEEAARGRTVVFATHYLEEADAFADRIVLVAEGRVIADGSTAQIRAQAAGRTVHATVPAPRRTAVVAALQAMEGVTDVSVQGDRLRVLAVDSDAVARSLLTDLGGIDLEIQTASLDDAFMALTGHSHEEDPR